MRGLWGQFLPALILLLAAELYLRRALAQGMGRFAWLQFFCVAFLTLPVIGLYHSLRWKSFITAFLMTLVFGLLLPLGTVFLIRALLLYQLAHMGINYHRDQSLSLLMRLLNSALIPNAGQICVAMISAFGLHLILRKRKFDFTRTAA